MRVNGIALGMAGQLRVAAELIMRGHKPSISLVDTGVDLVTEDGLRIQVKSSRLPPKDRKQRGYSFNLRRWNRSGPHGLENVDYMICWGVDTNQFWVFPVHLVRPHVNFRITPGGKKHGRPCVDRDRYENAWELLEKTKER